MHSREQYLERVREEYRNADKKTKKRLPNGARRRTRLNRKVLFGKLAHPPVLRVRKKRGAREPAYDSAVRVALIKAWEMFDCPCGQRLAPALRQEGERLRKTKDLLCSENGRRSYGRFRRRRSTVCWPGRSGCLACGGIGIRACTGCCIRRFR
jgi:hypothetical protein